MRMTENNNSKEYHIQQKNSDSRAKNLLLTYIEEFHKKKGKDLEREIGTGEAKGVRRGEENQQVKKNGKVWEEQMEQGRIGRGKVEQDTGREGEVNTKGKSQRVGGREVEEIGVDQSKEKVEYDQVWMDCDIDKGMNQLISVEVKEVCLEVKDKREVISEEFCASSNPRKKSK